MFTRKLYKELYGIRGIEAEFNLWLRKNLAQAWHSSSNQKCNTYIHGGRIVMVWGAIGAAGVGHLAFIDGISNKTTTPAFGEGLVTTLCFTSALESAPITRLKFNRARLGIIGSKT
ncbi:hypothetical protein Trydic_g8179 [Trypoxylus dichotomus]